jgi:hypothetical protein
MQHNKPSLSFTELNTLLVNTGVQTIVDHLVGSGNYQNNGSTLNMSTYMGGKEGGSFAITTKGANAGIWHENNGEELPNGKIRGDLVELWSLVNNISKHEVSKEIKAYLGIEKGQQPKVSSARKNHLVSVPTSSAPKAKAKLASEQTMVKYQGRLRNNPAALSYLYGRGLTDDTINHFRLGLTDKRSSVQYELALAAPVMSKIGFTSPYVLYNVPDVTVNPKHKNSWKSGVIEVSYNVVPTLEHRFVFVAEGLKDLWILHQIIQGTEFEKILLLATSTNGKIMPQELKDHPDLFARYEKVFLGHDNEASGAGDKIADNWAQYVGLKSHRVRPPFNEDQEGKDWTDFFKYPNNNIDVFIALLDKAEPINPIKLNTGITRLGDCKANGIMPPASLDVTSAFHNDLLYYSLKVMQSDEDKNGNMAVSEDIKVIRSDKVRLDVRAINPIARPTLIKSQLYRLSDDTIIQKAPRVSMGASWDITHAQAWIDGKFTPRALENIVCDMVTIMQSRIWLPNNDDYTILALTMVTTYVQQIFDAVPFLLATGVAGSGKTELGRVLQALGCNAVVTGDISAATITRLIDSTKGLLIIDDAEKLSKKGGAGNSQVDDLLQILKVSYKKSSAIRQVTDNKTMKVEELDFYGVKLFTNTTGMEDILGTRTIPIHTRKPLNGFKQAEMPIEKLRELRAELHAWAMENASKVNTVYRQFSTSNRDDEITTPFRVFAEMAKRKDWSELVDRLVSRLALERQTNDQDTEEGYVREAILNIARRGYVSVTMEHVLMEMELLVPENFGKSFTTEIPEWKHTKWIKRTLANMGFLSGTAGKRVRVHGKKDVPLQRVYGLSRTLFQEIRRASEDTYNAIALLTPIDGNDYCRQYAYCMECNYQKLSCEIKDKAGKR